MASSSSTNVSPGGEAGISSVMSSGESLRFFQEHGIFYQEDPEIGDLVESLGNAALTVGGMNNFQPRLEDPRIKTLLDSFSVRFSFTLGSDPGAFYAFTIETGPDQDNRRLVYMWRRGSRLEFSDGADRILLKGVRASNGYIQIPYPYLKRVKLNDVSVRLERGGIMITHPRLTFQVQEGFAIVYGCERSEQTAKSA